MDDDHSAWSPAPFQRQPGEQWIVVAPSFDTARATVLWTILGLTLVLVLVFYGRLLIAIPGIILNNYTIGAIGEAMAALRVTSAPVLRLTLLVALLTASWQWVAARPASAGSGRRVGLVGLAALLAVVLFWLPSFLPHLSSLGLPEAVSSFLPVALSAAALTATCFLLVRPRNQVALLWQTMLVGILMGTGLMLVLAYPVYTVAYTVLVSASAFTGLLHDGFVALCSLVGLLMILATGPLAVWWIAPATGKQRLVAGALAGLWAGVFLFGGLGGPLAGLVVNTPLYRIEFPPNGSDVSEYAIELTRAINNYFPLTYGLHWGLVGALALTGGLAGWLLSAPARQDQGLADSAVDTPPGTIPWPAAMLVTNLLPLAALTNLTVLLFLGETVQTTFDNYGVRPGWPATWTPLLSFIQPGLVFLLLQAIGLLQVSRHATKLANYRAIGWLITVNGYVNLIVWPFLLYAANPSWFERLESLLPMLVLMILGLEMLLLSQQMSQLRPDDRAEGHFTLTAWAAAGAVGAIPVAFLVHQSMAPFLNFLLIAAPIMGQLGQSPGTPVSPTWLARLFSPLFAIHMGIFLVVLIGLLLGGALLGLLLKAISALWLNSKVSAGVLARGCLSWLLAVAMVSGLGLMMLKLVGPSQLTATQITRPALVAGAVIALYLLFLFVRHPVGRLLLFGTAGLGVIVAGLAQGQPTFVLFSLLFIIGLGLMQRPFLERWARPDDASRWRAGGWMLLAIATAYLFGGFKLVLYIMALLLLMSLFRIQAVKHIHWTGLVLVFGLTLIGLLALMSDVLPFEQPWQWTLFLSCLGSVAGLTYWALRLYTPLSFRLAALLMIIPLLWISMFLGRTEIVPQGGISGYDHHQLRWFPLEGNSPLQRNLNYQFFTDSRRAWLWSSGTGLVVERSGQGYRTFLSPLASKQWNIWEDSRFELMAAHSEMVEDRHGRLWVVTPTGMSRLDPFQSEDNFIALVSVNPATRFETALAIHIKGWLTDIALDSTGDLWLATTATGILRLKTSPQGIPYWQSFTTRNSGLPTNEVHLLYIDRTGHIWAGTAQGVSRFNGHTWIEVALPGSESRLPVNTIFEDEQGNLWVGTPQGGYRLGREKLTSLNRMAGWPASIGAELFFQDPQGHVWAGTASGAFRLENQQWVELVPNLHVTAFAGEFPDVVWLGGRQGLVRYEAGTGNQQRFDTANSGLPADWVRDLYLEQNGRLWVSTFAVEHVTGSPWWGIALMTLFFGFLCTKTFRGCLSRSILDPTQKHPARYAR